MTPAECWRCLNCVPVLFARRATSASDEQECGAAATAAAAAGPRALGSSLAVSVALLLRVARGVQRASVRHKETTTRSHTLDRSHRPLCVDGGRAASEPMRMKKSALFGGLLPLPMPLPMPLPLMLSPESAAANAAKPRRRRRLLRRGPRAAPPLARTFSSNSLPVTSDANLVMAAPGATQPDRHCTQQWTLGARNVQQLYRARPERTLCRIAAGGRRRTGHLILAHGALSRSQGPLRRLCSTLLLLLLADHSCSRARLNQSKCLRAARQQISPGPGFSR